MNYNIRLFGAVGDGISKDTQAIQQAIDACSQTGGAVVIPAGNYLCGTLILKNNVTLILEENACILGSDDFQDYRSDVNLFVDAVDHQRGRSLIYCEGQRNVAITGSGQINGRGGRFHVGHPHHTERPFLVRILDTCQLRIEGVTLCNSAAWCVHLQNCEDIRIAGVTVDNRVNYNNDGIDLDACRRVTVADCHIQSNDDALCLKATVNRVCGDIMVERCRLFSDWAAFKLGTESVGDFENITFRDSLIYDTVGCAIKIVPVDGGCVRHVNISNIRLLNSTGPVFLANGERLRTYQKENFREQPGTISDVTISGLRGDCVDAHRGMDNGWGDARTGIVISGTPDYPVKDIVLKDCDLLLEGGVTQKPQEPVPEMGTRYPEFHNFGTLPASGVYVRHAENVRIEDVRIQLRQEDVREQIVQE